MKELNDNITNSKKFNRKNFLSIMGLSTLSLVIIKSIPFNRIFKRNTTNYSNNVQNATAKQIEIKINPYAVKRNRGEKNV